MSNWEPLPTPNPAEFAIRVRASPTQVLGKMGALVAGTTTLKEFDLATAPSSEGIGDYIYTYATGPDDGGRLAFHFAKPKTDAEKRTPWRSQIERMGNHRWPDILVALAVTTDYSFPRSASIIDSATNVQGIVTAPRYRIAEALIPEMNEGTRFLVQEFLSPTVFTIPRYRLPCATSVSLTLPDGTGYSHGECLHDTIELDPLPTAQSTLLSGSAGNAGGIMGGQRFPASNFKTWRPYWFSDEQQLRDGVWYRRRVRVIPPRVPDVQLRLN